MFKPYECVRVSETYFRKEIAGKVGAILGFSKDRKSGMPIYGVMLDDLGECWSIEHYYLSSEGYIRKKDEFYDGTFVKVKVDPKTGEGYLDEQKSHHFMRPIAILKDIDLNKSAITYGMPLKNQGYRRCKFFCVTATG